MLYIIDNNQNRTKCFHVVYQQILTKEFSNKCYNLIGNYFYAQLCIQAYNHTQSTTIRVN